MRSFQGANTGSSNVAGNLHKVDAWQGHSAWCREDKPEFMERQTIAIANAYLLRTGAFDHEVRSLLMLG